MSFASYLTEKSAEISERLSQLAEFGEVITKGIAEVKQAIRSQGQSQPSGKNGKKT